MSILLFIKALKNYTFTRVEILLFFIFIFFVIFGILSFIEKFTRIIQTPSSQIEEMPVIKYPSQKITIETPFATEMSVNEPIFPDHICSIIDYGAIADGKTLNTEAFEKAIDSCASSGGGKVNVPAGVWLTGPIHLRSNINLHIERDATILFSTNARDYLPVVFSRFEGIEYYNYSPPIYAENSTNVAITGVGTLDGQGPVMWWKMKDRATVSINKLYAQGDDNVPLTERVFGTETAGLRPAFIEFVHSSNILIEDIKIQNGPMWTIHPIYSDNIIVRGVDIATSPGPSTDGIAIDSSVNVLVENTTLDTGDDAIVLKSGRDREGIRLHLPTENVVIRNCTIKDAHGAIAIGSEMSGDVRNVFVSDINISTAQYGFRIKATRGRGGIVENIWVQNVNIRNASIEAVQITTAYGLPFRVDSTTPPLFRNIHLKNISARKTSQAISVDGLPELPISDISFEDITLPTRLGIELTDTDTISFKNMRLTLKDSDPLFEVTDSSHIDISDSLCGANTPICLSLKGNKSSEINIRDSGFEKEKIKVLPGANPEALTY